MVFSSLVFIFLFMPIFFIAYFIFKNIAYRNALLLLASLFFYAWGEPIYVLLMLSCITINYILAIIIEKQKNPKFGLILAIAINLLILGIFKYTDFLISSINSIFNISIPLKNISLPIGISFFTFQTLSYVIDVYRKEVKVQKNPLFLGAYVAAFPQLIAGPIVRYQTIEYELVNRKESIEEFAEGARRFITGLFKKIVIANTMGIICDSILATSPSQYQFAGAWLGIISYTLQIYFDFSGYSDMAIGLGRMMGFHFLENFNYPYIAKSITDFWRRWHISLSTFFKDYVYIPLGGNRVKLNRWVVNLLIVWFLTGLWHGANWNYILWGLYYGIILIIEKLFLGKYIEKSGKILSHIYTLFIVMVGWALFRIEDFTQLIEFIKAMFFANGFGNINYFVYIQIFQLKYILIMILAVFAATPVFKNIKNKLESYSYGKIFVDIFLILMFITSIFFLIVSDYNPFIYFKF